MGDPIPTKALKVSYSFYDDIPLHRSITRFHFPKLDDNADAQLYELQIQDKVVIDSLRGYDNGHNLINISKCIYQYLIFPFRILCF